MLDGSGLLDLAHAAQWACVSPRTFRRWIERGLRVQRETSRSKILVRPADIESFLTAQQASRPDLDAMVADTLQELQQGGVR
jgi:hypothetical protein